MSLIKCKECVHEVSTGAKACPNCGWILPAKIGLGLLFLIIFIIVIYVSIYNMLVDNNLAEPEKIKPSNTSELQITADKILLDYRNNKIRADSYYKNKLVKVSGIINDFGKDNLGTPYMILNSNKPIFTVQCKFEKSSEGKLVNLKKGQEIYMVGRVSGEFSNVILMLEDCLIDEYKSNSPSNHLSQQEIKICNTYSNEKEKDSCLKEFEDMKKVEINKQITIDGRINTGDKIMSMNNDAINAIFYTMLKSTESGKGCIPKENFFQGNNGNKVYWNIRCEDGRAFGI